jgi:hypothetical protein
MDENRTSKILYASNKGLISKHQKGKELVCPQGLAQRQNWKGGRTTMEKIDGSDGSWLALPRVVIHKRLLT